jgi:hypothetical protein
VKKASLKQQEEVVTEASGEELSSTMYKREIYRGLEFNGSQKMKNVTNIVYQNVKVVRPCSGVAGYD